MTRHIPSRAWALNPVVLACFLTALPHVDHLGVDSARAHAADQLQLLETLAPLVDRIVSEVEHIPAQRREILDQAAQVVSGRLAGEGDASLTFICTHNSRRSHMSQIWAQVAADYYGLTGVRTFSGGTEATACNIRTVRALRRAGLQVVASTGGTNPKYLVQYSDNRPPVLAFSKTYNSKGNPQEDYVAMMCCSDADEKCPVVSGAVARIPLHYSDPKVSDGTKAEAATYDARCRQIAREMFYVFAKISTKTGL